MMIALKGAMEDAIEMYLLLHLLIQLSMHKRVQNSLSCGGYHAAPQGAVNGGLNDALEGAP